jgi:hypothetical protein
LEITKLLELIHQYPSWFRFSIVCWIIVTGLLIAGMFFLYPNSNVNSPPAAVKLEAPAGGKGAATPTLPPRPTTDISVEEIVESVRSRPPLQQGDVAKQYIGIEVDWVGYLIKAEPEYGSRSNARVNLNVNKDEAIDYSIWFSVDLEVMPEFKILTKKSKVRVKGRITSVSVGGLSVDLAPNEVLVLDRS